MAEQERLREEAQRLQDEEEAQERAKIEQEENERLQKQVRNATSFLRILSDTLHCVNTCTDKYIYRLSSSEFSGIAQLCQSRGLEVTAHTPDVLSLLDTWVQICHRLCPE